MFFAIILQNELSRVHVCFWFENMKVLTKALPRFDVDNSVLAHTFSLHRGQTM